MYDLRIKNHNPDVYIYSSNVSSVFTKETLLDIVQHNQNKIINGIVNSIVYAVLYQADRGRKVYYWRDSNDKLDDDMYDKVKDKLSYKFPDIKIEYYPNYDILLDWNHNNDVTPTLNTI
jgi:hypothetical protein